MGEIDGLLAPPIFVVGHNRSGTTWVFDLLTYPGDVAGIFESWMFTSDLGLGGLLQWGHWRPDHIEGLTAHFGRRPGIGQILSRDEVVDLYRRMASDILGRACGPGVNYLVEKTPDHLYAAPTISELFPHARFINVIRDGRDVAVSMRAAVRWNSGQMPRSMGSMLHVARRWRTALEFSRDLATKLGDRYCEISYEALHADPYERLAELYTFCGFKADRALIDGAIKSFDFDTNFERGDDRFRRAGRIGDWRKAMNLRDRMEFHRGAGRELIARGYERSRWWWLRRPAVDENVSTARP